VTPLHELFPDGDFRFHLTLRRGEPRRYFLPLDTSGGVLSERRHWLALDPDRYCACEAGGEPLVAEFHTLCQAWHLVDAADGLPSRTDSRAALRWLGARLEPDVLLLSPDATGRFVLRAGILCFPTGWALAEKLGHTLDSIHGIVPGLNSALATPIHQFLTKLKPGTAFLRDNWGLSATNERNAHPGRQLPPPALPVAFDRLWLRVEHQALFALPSSGGIVFSIRISLHRLDEVTRDPFVAAGLARALASMPESLAAYKRLDTVRDEFVRQLNARPAARSAE
jgi:hypothetical protein